MDIVRHWRNKTIRIHTLASGHGNPEMLIPSGIYERKVEMQVYEMDEFGKFMLVNYLINRDTGERKKV